MSSPPELEKSLILYLSVTKSTMESMLAQDSDKKVEKAIYYLSKKMQLYKTRYTLLEKGLFSLGLGYQEIKALPISTFSNSSFKI